MAIDKTINTEFGIDLNHHVIFNIEIFRAADQISFRIKGYPDASNYNNDNATIKNYDYLYNFDQLPAAVLTAIVNLKNEIETALLGTATYSGGSIVADWGLTTTTSTTTSTTSTTTEAPTTTTTTIASTTTTTTV